MNNYRYTAKEAKQVRKDHLNYIGGMVDDELVIDYLLILPDDENFERAFRAQTVDKVQPDVIADTYGDGENLMVRYVVFVKPIMISGNIEEDKEEKLTPKDGEAVNG